MDLISQIIARKQQKPINLLSLLDDMLKDIIIYDKLKAKAQFQDLAHPVIQKKCPTLVKILDTGSIERALYQELAPLLTTFNNYNWHNLIQTENKQDKIEQILNKSFGIEFCVYDMTNLQSEPDEWVAISHTAEDSEKLFIFVEEKTKLIVYSAQLTADGYMRQEIKPITVKIDNDYISLQSFSQLGNNDYVFASINSQPVRIRDNQLHVGQMKLDLPEGWLQVLQMDATSNDIETDIATYLLQKYKEGTR